MGAVTTFTPAIVRQQLSSQTLMCLPGSPASSGGHPFLRAQSTLNNTMANPRSGWAPLVACSHRERHLQLVIISPERPDLLLLATACGRSRASRCHALPSLPPLPLLRLLLASAVESVEVQLQGQLYQSVVAARRSQQGQQLLNARIKVSHRGGQRPPGVVQPQRLRTDRAAKARSIKAQFLSPLSVMKSR